MQLIQVLGKSNTTLRRMAAGLSTAGVCTDARTYDPLQVGWCTRSPSWTEKETPGAASAGVAAALPAFVPVKLSWRRHDAPGTRLVCYSDVYEGRVAQELTKSSSLFLSFLR
jgi:hypothetical protein